MNASLTSECVRIACQNRRSSVGAIAPHEHGWYRAMNRPSIAPRSPVALFATSSLIWGSTWLAIKFQLGTVSPDVSVAYRFALAALLLGGWCALTRRSLRFDARTHAFLALQGSLLFGFNYVGVYWAEHYATSGLLAVLFSTIVFMNPVGARWLFGTPLTLRTLVAAVLGVVGGALVFVPERVHAARRREAARAPVPART